MDLEIQPEHFQTELESIISKYRIRYTLGQLQNIKDKSTYQIRTSLGLSDASDRDIHVYRSITFNDYIKNLTIIRLECKVHLRPSKKFAIPYPMSMRNTLKIKAQRINVPTMHVFILMMTAAGAKFSSNHFAVGLIKQAKSLRGMITPLPINNKLYIIKHITTCYKYL